MNLNDLLQGKDIDPKHVIVLRHRPNAPELNKVLPWLAAEKPDLFNAYQQTQGERVERAMQAMTGIGYVASFIGREPGKALFVGLYSIGKSKPLSRKEFWQVPAYVELKKFGMRGFADEHPEGSVLWFDLALTDFYAHWKGKLTVGWPSPERSWWRRAHLNVIPVVAVLEDSALDAAMKEWDEIEFSWEELGILPTRWRSLTITAAGPTATSTNFRAALRVCWSTPRAQGRAIIAGTGKDACAMHTVLRVRQTTCRVCKNSY